MDSGTAARGAPMDELVDALGLQPHPEGGYFRETFRSGQVIVFNGAARSAATSIYYLLAYGAYSAWHRIDADETWYFHAGGPLLLHEIRQGAELVTHRLGNALSHPGAVFQATVRAGTWFAAELGPTADFALAGCAVSPGFEFSGFQLAGARDIAEAASRYGARVERLLAS